MKKRSRYHRYMKSKAWAVKREALLSERGRCEMCGAWENLQVHHASYKRLQREAAHDLYVLCVGCHHYVHELKDRMKVTLGRATLLAFRDHLEAV